VHQQELVLALDKLSRTRKSKGRIFRNTMKKLTNFAKEFGLSIASIALPLLASAQISQPPVTAPTTYTNINQVTGSAGIICVIINWIFWLLIVLTIIFVLRAAFKYLTAAGDPTGVKEAGSMLLYAAIAVVVALIAKGFPLLISSFITSGGIGSTGC
jgi:hypothetical protein